MQGNDVLEGGGVGGVAVEENLEAAGSGSRNLILPMVWSQRIDDIFCSLGPVEARLKSVGCP